MQVYVLSNCDTCRKAQKWLRDNEVKFESVDIRKDGISRQVISAAISNLGWERVLNRRSTSWRNLDETARAGLDDAKAVELIVDTPTLMKRPLFVLDEQFLAGFDDEIREKILASGG